MIKSKNVSLVASIDKAILKSADSLRNFPGSQHQIQTRLATTKRFVERASECVNPTTCSRGIFASANELECGMSRRKMKVAENGNGDTLS